MELACNDDGEDFEGNDLGLQSAVQFEAEEGALYFLFVDGFRQPGDFQLNIGPCGGGDEEPDPVVIENCDDCTPENVIAACVDRGLELEACERASRELVIECRDSFCR